MTLRTLMLALMLMMPVASMAQASLVPLTHPVYDWLHHQRVGGRITGFHIDLAPYSRADITAYLAQVELTAHQMSAFERMTLRSFQREFDAVKLRQSNVRRSLSARTGLKERVVGLLIDQPEPYLYRYTSSDTTFEGYLYVQRGKTEFNAWDDGQWRWSRTYVKGVRGFLNTDDGIGLHADIDNVFAMGDQGLLNEVPTWAHTYATDVEPQNRSSYSYEIFASVHRRLWRADLGRGSLDIGPSVTDALVLRRNAPNMNWAKVVIGTNTLNYMVLHGSLRSYTSLSTLVVDGDTTLTRTAPPRWLAMHRLTLEPIPQLTLGVQEVVVYGNRPADLMYMNPLMPYVFAEMDAGDMDSKFLGGDIRLRLFPGNELFGSLFIDDLTDFPSLLRSDGSKVALNAGFRQNLPGSTQLAGSYTRIDAHMYTHFQRLNTYENARQSLGHRLGPNAEEFALQLSGWLPLRTRFVGDVILAKKGLNPPDANVGGDLLDGVGVFGALYEGADVQETLTLNLQVQTQPLRGFQLSAAITDTRVLTGDRITPFRFIDLRFGYGF